MAKVGRAGERAQYKTIKGVEHKLCTGTLHREGKWVPLDQWYKRTLSSGKITQGSMCKHCVGALTNTEVMVPFSRLAFALRELQFRLGKAETQRRLGVSYNTIWMWEHKEARHMQRRIARRMISLLHEARENGEVRHRKSIKHGAYLRGRKEKVPKRPQDFNGPNDGSTQYRRQYIHENEEFRQSENAKRRARHRAKREKKLTTSE